MNKRAIIISLITAAVLLAGGGGFLYLRAQSAEESVVATPAGSIPLDQNQKKEPVKSALPITNNKGAQQGSGLAVQDQGGGSSSTSTNNQPKTLTPDDFKQFDQYKEAQTAMFVEMKEGTGKEAAMNSKLTVNYRGWLTNGQQFDESYARGKPFEFVIGEHRVIQGWEQGLFGMKQGGKRLLIVPPAVGYGNQPKDPIPANSVLVFEIELLKVE